MGKDLEYLRYIIRHKAYVFVECCRLGIPWRGVAHDLSKFRPAEWVPYREYFYGENKNDRIVRDLRQGAFDEAWLEHIHANPHHWQHWLLQEDEGERARPLVMPEVHVREMLADWRGMARARGKASVKEWYREARKTMQLNWYTERKLHSLMTPEELPEEVRNERKS